MAETNQYINLINDIIAKQKLILGPDIVRVKAKNVVGLKLDSEDRVVGIEGDPQTILQKLVDEYIDLSGEIVKNILSPVFEKYPDIKVSIK